MTDLGSASAPQDSENTEEKTSADRPTPVKIKQSEDSTEKPAESPSCCSGPAATPVAFIGWGFLFSVVYCVIVAVATHVHWPTSDLCLFPPLQDLNGTHTDFPNPRCPDTSRFDQDQGTFWYYWRLPETLWYSQFTAWMFYMLHQGSFWGLIYVAQRQYSSDLQPKLDNNDKYAPTMRKLNWWAMGINAFFVVLHLLHTHFMGYDALAPSVHEFASEGSVILLLVITMMMETDRRGMFFGQPVFLFNEALDVAKRYHGYLFSWAITFTFWYHPMEGYFGHLFGIFHVLILMLQGSLMFTNAHLHRTWRMVLEAWVFLHASVISTQTLFSNSWPVFVFGFGAIFVISQLPGLPCMLKCHVAVRAIPFGVFAVVYVLAFKYVTEWTSVGAGAFIPVAVYLGAIGLNLVVMLFLVIGRACCKERCLADANQRPASTPMQRVGFTVFFVVIMALIIVGVCLAEVVIDRESTLATVVICSVMGAGLLFSLVVRVVECALVPWLPTFDYHCEIFAGRCCSARFRDP